MIRLLKRKEIDIEKWNQCIAKSNITNLFAFSWYLDSCCAGWSALVEDDYKTVFPLSIKNKFGIRYLYQPFFTRYLGVFSSKEISQNDQLNFINAIPDSIKYWDFCLHEGHKTIPEKAIVSEKKYQLLNLNADYSVIRSSYTGSHVRNLKKAEKEQTVIYHDFDPAKVVEQFQIHQKEKQLGFAENDFDALNLLMKAASSNTKTICMAAKNPSGEILAGAFFIEFQNRLLYLKGFSSEQGKKSGAMHLLFDTLIKSKTETDCILDFGGSDVESVARFFKGFGAADCLYLHIRLNRLPKIIKWLKR